MSFTALSQLCAVAPAGPSRENTYFNFFMSTLTFLGNLCQRVSLFPGPIIWTRQGDEFVHLTSLLNPMSH